MAPPRSDSPFGADEETRFDRSAAALSLEGLNGPLEGRVFGSDGWPITLGRSSGCAIMLPIQESSRTHARIEYERGRFWVLDLKTLNGTRLNDRLVDEATALREGDRIAICGQEFAVHLSRIPGRVLVSDHFDEAPFVERQGKSSFQNTKPQLVPVDPAPLQRWLIAGALVLILASIGIVTWRWVTQRPDRRPPLAQDTRPAKPTAPEVGRTTASVPRAHEPLVQPLPFPATLEPQGIVTVASDREGVVREVTPRGTRVDLHQRLALVERDSPLAQKKLAHLRELTRKYGSSDEYADFIDEAKRDYERESETKVQTEVQSPTRGIVIAARVKVGQSLRRGDAVADVAATVRLTVDNAVVEGSERLCRVVLFERGDLTVTGRLLDPSAEHARTRTLELVRLPAGLDTGAVGRVRVDCNR